MINVIFRTMFFYFFIILSYRLMGKREMGQLGIIDLIVSILIAELVAISIEQENKSIFLTILPIAVLVILEIGLAFISLKSKLFKKLFNGKPVYIIKNGQVNFHEMLQQRYLMDDLLLALRQSQIKNIADVEYAILETNGTLSVFPYNIIKSKSAMPLPLIIDGNIQYYSLKALNKDEQWLHDELYKKNIDLTNVFYAFKKNHSIYFITK